MASQLGPANHFRCNEFGHTCPRGVTGDYGRGVPHPSRNAPNNDVNQTVSYDNCGSDDTEGYLVSARETADAIKRLEADAGRAVVASIQGPPSPYTVHWTAPSPADDSCGSASCPWPAITHSCTTTDGRVGDPGVRNAQLVQDVGVNGLQLSVCDDSFGPGLARVAMLINRTLSQACIPGQVASNAAGQPDCKVTQTSLNGSGQPMSPAAVPSCADSGDSPPCWQLQTTASCPGQSLTVLPDPDLPASGQGKVNYDCAK
jgi:hypothetical protein